LPFALVTRSSADAPLAAHGTAHCAVSDSLRSSLGTTRRAGLSFFVRVLWCVVVCVVWWCGV
jgi:hypothetical protein